ncbi:Aste57867_16306 [Aphanomyces stellatus]|uniref:Aste57867_16306 protein n=1 Tax=Aphanomyces stellatus TaxID=120398 RepID=A0A485L716_9STRA|nr:hypothetical protein As57867_016249 [Aphanomyces stellatus]VFT93082.1 Aste57867_16306 [Aphanomyces stellatus]
MDRGAAWSSDRRGNKNGRGGGGGRQHGGDDEFNRRPHSARGGRGGGRGGYQDGGPPKRGRGDSGGRGRGDRGGGRGGNEKPMALTEEFIMYVATELKSLRDDPTVAQLTFPSTLDNTQRRYIHNMAAKHGFHSKSTGKADARFIFITRAKTTATMQTVSLRVPPTPLAISPETHAQMVEFLAAFPSAPPAGPCPNNCCQHHHQQKTLVPMAPPPPAVSHGAHGNAFAKKPPPPPSPTPHVYGDGQRNLPAFAHREEILALSAAHQVLVVAGDTGCGKSTQIPQFLLDAHGGAAGRVVVTQPRRISAITLAQRIADERDVALGTDVGYAIRLDAKYSAASTRLLFCTTGMLLKWLSSDPIGTAFTTIVLDEVHERDKHTDFLLILLHLILPRRPDLRVILMSATIQVDKFASYFDQCPVVHIQGRMFPVLSCFLDDVLVLTNGDHVGGGVTTLSLADQYELKCVMCNSTAFATEVELGMHVAMCFGTDWAAPDDATPDELAVHHPTASNLDTDDVLDSLEGSVCDHVRQILDAKKKALKAREIDQMVSQYQLAQDALDMERGIDVRLVVELLRHLMSARYGDGAILVFVPGWEDIVAIADLVEMDGPLMGDLVLTMLHSRLSPAEQRRAFQRAPRGKRKVILATNIAETSVTIEDVVYVIDTGKSKQSSVVNGYTALHTEWISQANCAQRRGRAGRVAPGVCFHLMTTKRHDDLPPFMTPELLAISLEEIVLNIQLLQYHARDTLGFESIAAFLHMALDPPTDHAIDQAIAALQLMGALDDGHELTFLGWKLAQLAVPPAIGKMILLGHFCHVYDCLLYACCALTFRDPFVSDLGMPPSQKEQRKQIKRQLGQTTASDHLVVHAALQQYLDAKRTRRVGPFCQQNWLVGTTLEHILGVVKQVGNEFAALGYAARTAGGPTNMAMAQAVLGSGLYPNLMYRASGGGNFTTKDKFKVKLSSSTVLVYSKPGKAPPTGGQVDWVCFHDMMQSDRVRVAQVATKVSPFAMAIFIGHEAVLEDMDNDNADNDGEDDAQADIVRVVIDDWAVLHMVRSVAEMVLVLRTRVQDAFLRHLHHDTKGTDAAIHDGQLLRSLHEWMYHETQ